MRKLEKTLKKLQKSNNLFNFINQIITLFYSREESILFPIHKIFQLQGSPADKNQEILHEVKCVKKEYDQIVAEKQKITFQKLLKPPTAKKEAEPTSFLEKVKGHLFGPKSPDLKPPEGNPEDALKKKGSGPSGENEAINRSNLREGADLSKQNEVDGQVNQAEEDDLQDDLSEEPSEPVQEELEEFPGMSSLKNRSIAKKEPKVRNNENAQLQIPGMSDEQRPHSIMDVSVKENMMSDPNAPDARDTSYWKMKFALKSLRTKTQIGIEALTSLDPENKKDLEEKIVQDYDVNDDVLLDELHDALKKNDSIRETLIQNMKVPIHELKSHSEQELKFPLKDSFTFNWFKTLERFPSHSVQHYYGDKVTLYFSFLNYFRDRLVSIAFLGMLVMIPLIIYMVISPTLDIEEIKTNKFVNFYYATQIIFSIYIVIWIKRFAVRWIEYERRFGIMYGEVDEDVNQAEDVRPGFQGVWLRNLVDDKMNDIGENGMKKKRKLFLTGLVVMVITVLAGVTSYYILTTKRTAFDNHWLNPNYSDGFNTSTSSQSSNVTSVRLLQASNLTGALDNLTNLTNLTNSSSLSNTTDTTSTDGLDLTSFASGDPISSDSVYNQLAIGDQIQSTYLDPNELLFNGLEVIRIYFFQYLFRIVIKLLMSIQNLKYKAAHEQRLILFLSVFQIFNSSFMIIIVMWQALFDGQLVRRYFPDGTYEDVEQNTCIEGDCNRELAVFYLLYCLAQIAFIIGFKFIFLSITSYITSKVASTFAKLVSKETNHVRSGDLDNISTGVKKSNKDIIKDIVGIFYTSGPGINHLTVEPEIQGTPVNSLETKENTALVAPAQNKGKGNIYWLANKEIERQVKDLKGDEANNDYDPILDKYLEVVTSLSSTALFGVLFPISFLTTWLVGIVQYLIEKNDILAKRKRPIPERASTIGLWNEVINIICFLAIITNTYFVAFVLLINKDIYVKFIVFVIMIMALIVVNMVYDSIKDRFEGYTNVMLKRAYFIGLSLFGYSARSGGSKEKLKIERSNRVFNAPNMIKPITNLKDLVSPEEDEAEKKELLLMEVVHKIFMEENKKFEEHLTRKQEIFSNPKDQHQSKVYDSIGRSASPSPMTDLQGVPTFKNLLAPQMHFVQASSLDDHNGQDTPKLGPQGSHFNVTQQPALEPPRPEHN